MYGRATAFLTSSSWRPDAKPGGFKWKHVSMFKLLNCCFISCLHPLHITSPPSSPKKFSTKRQHRKPTLPFATLLVKSKFTYLIPSHFRLHTKIKVCNHFNLTEGNTLLNCLCCPRSDHLSSPCNTTFHAIPSLVPVKRLMQLHCEPD